jgi:hypothetical protein
VLWMSLERSREVIHKTQTSSGWMEAVVTSRAGSGSKKRRDSCVEGSALFEPTSSLPSSSSCFATSVSLRSDSGGETMGSKTLLLSGVSRLAGKWDGRISWVLCLSVDCFVRGLQAEMYCMSHQDFRRNRHLWGVHWKG